MDGEVKEVWVFSYDEDRWVAAVFSSRKEAEIWIDREKRVGVLTKYVLDIGETDEFPEHYHYNYPDD